MKSIGIILISVIVANIAGCSSSTKYFQSNINGKYYKANDDTCYYISNAKDDTLNCYTKQKNFTGAIYPVQYNEVLKYYNTIQRKRTQRSQNNLIDSIGTYKRTRVKDPYDCVNH